MADESSSYLSGINAAWLDSLYEQYSEDQSSVSPMWQQVFSNLNEPAPNYRGGYPPSHLSESGDISGSREKQGAVFRLINAHRVRGHQAANLDPLGLTLPRKIPDLSAQFHGLEEKDMDSFFDTGSLALDGQMKLRDIISFVGDVYCDAIGAEYMYITDTEQKRWIQSRLEGLPPRPHYPDQERRTTLELLTAAEGLERYLHTRYVGQKRFSLEGGESTIPLLHELIQRAGASGTREIVVGMAHRGRLNVLINILGKVPADLFAEFEGSYGDFDLDTHTGDVKYHQGFSSDINTPGGPVHLALSFNPSHLEIIDPVIEGSVRARQERRNDIGRNQVLPLLIHGDAAFAGQGVVMETLNMSQARGYSTGGTVHLIINNQIGFTMSNPLDARSTLYCTEVAKLVQAPIFHVNADDPDAVLQIARIALDFRMQFNKDVVIDLVCYRRHGHNEADDPMVTQATMYKAIKKHPSVRQRYAEQLVQRGIVSVEETEKWVEQYRNQLDSGEVVAKNITRIDKSLYLIDWSPFLDKSWEEPADTSVPLNRISRLSELMSKAPDDFVLHPRVAKILANRTAMASGKVPIDWGYAENLAYASLIEEGYPVRLSGQDSGRGTFFHRHAVLHNQEDRNSWVPLRNIPENPNQFLVINSLLSEEAVLGFEYGYATTEPNTLVIWEAQFGDFANGAQVVIDQFISSGQAKWSRLCGLVMLLPHGYEGQGPEHSSARLERYLQLCSEHNMQVCTPTTPAQIFHLLRRQMLRHYRQPLVIMSPKSLLRHKMATSALDELTDGGFKPVIGEIDNIADAKSVERIIICCGKVYYDLLQERATRKLDRVAILRIEQLKPFPGELLKAEIKKYPKALDVVWCQEEPKNQGAWYQIRHNLQFCLNPQHSLVYAGREASASPAVGYYKLHVQQQTELVAEALTQRHQPVEKPSNVERININVN